MGGTRIQGDHGLPAPFQEDERNREMDLSWERVTSLSVKELGRKVLWRCQKRLRRSPFFPAASRQTLENLATEWRNAPIQSPPPLTPSDRFFLPAQAGNSITKAAIELFPSEVELTIADGEKTLAGEFKFLGYPTVKVSGSLPYQGNPVPEIDTYFRRMDFLVSLALSFAYTKRPEFLSAYRRLVAGWLGQPGLLDRVLAESGIEVSIRLINWVMSLRILLAAGQTAPLSEDLSRNTSAWMAIQARVIELKLSAGGNHLLLDALGLRMLGCAFPHLDPTRNREVKGRSILLRELHRQVREDGVHGEQSAGYHLNVTTYYLKEILLSRARKESIPKNAWNRLGNMFEYASHLLKPDGTIPMMGDLDGFRTRYREHLETRMLYSAGLVLFPEKATPYPPELETHLSLWYLGPDLTRRARSLNQVRRQSYVPGTRSFPSGGVVILRDPHNATSVHFDCGPFGLEEFPHHGHADCLSVEVCAFSRSVLIDPGGFAYHRNRFRSYFRSTAAHNTIRIDGVDQTRIQDLFEVGRTAKPAPPLTLRRHEFDFAEGAHQGYMRLSDPVFHRRAVFLIKSSPSYVVVLDRLEGTGQHQVEQRYQCVPLPTLPRIHKSRVDVLLPEKNRLSVLFPSSLTGEPAMNLRVVSGAQQPVEGWVSFVKGELEPAPQIIRSGFLRLPVDLCTVLYPWSAESKSRRKRPRIRRKKQNSTSAIGLEIKGEDWIDRLSWNPQEDSINTLDDENPTRVFYSRSINRNP